MRSTFTLNPILPSSKPSLFELTDPESGPNAKKKGPASNPLASNLGAEYESPLVKKFKILGLALFGLLLITVLILILTLVVRVQDSNNQEDAINPPGPNNDAAIVNPPTLYVSLQNTFYSTANGATVNIHYNNGAGWTTAPGVAMTPGKFYDSTSASSGWYSFMIKCSAPSVSVTFDFNNAGNNWMNNNNNNYVVAMSTTDQAVQVIATSITTGALSSTSIPTSPLPTVGPSVSPSPTPSVQVVTTTASTSSLPIIQVYLQNPFYSTSSGAINIHYNNGAGWTTSPGVPMKTGYGQLTPVPSGNGWYNFAIVCSGPSVSVSFVFNNGGNNWMNNNNLNYAVTAGALGSVVSVQVIASSITVGTLTILCPTCTTQVPSPTPSAPTTIGVSSFVPKWSPLTQLRDQTSPGRNGVSMPSGGWYVTPIHITLIPSNGDLLVTGWARASPSNCVKPGGSRLFGVTWRTSVSAIAAGGTQVINPINEKGLNSADTLYCSGQVTLRDGRILYVGGATYQNLGLPNEIELGLNYLRIFDPTTNSFSIVSGTLPQTVWYPTATLLDSGKVLIYGGFTQFCAPNPVTGCPNKALYTWDPSTGAFATLISSAAAWSDPTPSEKDYSHVFVLLAPGIPANGYDIALIGNAAKMDYFSTSQAAFAYMGDRPGSRAGYDTTAVLLTNGDILIAGGGDSSQIDIFSPSQSSWRSTTTKNVGLPINSGQTRDNGASIMLPTGEVLLINGYSLYSTTSSGANNAVKVNTDTGAISTWFTESDVPLRGYHNIGILNKDGNIIVGGGCWANGDIGCEHPDYRFIQVYNDAERPVISGSIVEPLHFQLIVPSSTSSGPFSLSSSGSLSFTVDRVVTSVSLLTAGSFTHGFNQNQRRIQLSFTQQGNVVTLTSALQNTVAGNYILFFMSNLNVPSKGIFVQLSH